MTLLAEKQLSGNVDYSSNGGAKFKITIPIIKINEKDLDCNNIIYSCCSCNIYLRLSTTPRASRIPLELAGRSRRLHAKVLGSFFDAANFNWNALAIHDYPPD